MINKIKGQMFIYIIAFSFLLLVVYVYISTPVTGDINVFFGAAKHAAQSNKNFPANVYEAWELKPIGNRAIIYFLYKITSKIISVNNIILFDIFVKAINGIVFIGVSCCTAKKIWEYFKLNKQDFYLYLILWYVAYFTCSLMVPLQAEDFALIILLIAINFLLSTSNTSVFVGGIMVSLLFPIKGVTILYSLFLLIILFIVNKEERKRLLINGFSGFFIGIIMVIILVLIWFPNEIQELYNATLFQKSFAMPLTYRIPMMWIKFMENKPVPIIFSGIISTVLVMVIDIINYNKSKLKNILILTYMWGISSTYVIIQARFYAYHYLPFIIPSYIAVIIFLKSLSLKKNRIKKCIILIILLSTIPFYIQYTAPPISKTITKIREQRDINIETSDYFEKYTGLNTEKSLVTLCDGNINRFIKPMSYLKYYYPLPIQRNNPQLEKSEIRKKLLTEITEYEGRYIIIQYGWIDISKYEEITRKINKEYKSIYKNTAYELYEKIY